MILYEIYLNSRNCQGLLLLLILKLQILFVVVLKRVVLRAVVDHQTQDHSAHADTHEQQTRLLVALA